MYMEEPFSFYLVMKRDFGMFQSHRQLIIDYFENKI